MDMVVHTFNLSTQEAGEFEASQVYSEFMTS